MADTYFEEIVAASGWAVATVASTFGEPEEGKVWG